MKYSDKEIIEHINQGEKQKVLRFVYDFYYPKIFNFLRKKSTPEEDIKDIFQDSVLILLKRILENGYGEDTNIGGFLMRISSQLWIDKIRKDKKIQFDGDKLVDKIVETDYTFIKDTEKTNLMNQIFESVGDKCTQIIKLVYFSGYNMKEVAESLGFSTEDSAKTQHYRCKQKLIKKYRNNPYLKEVFLGH